MVLGVPADGAIINLLYLSPRRGKAGVMRFTTALDWLRDEGTRVNCLVPDSVATAEVQGYVDSLRPGGARKATCHMC